MCRCLWGGLGIVLIGGRKMVMGGKGGEGEGIGGNWKELEERV